MSSCILCPLAIYWLRVSVSVGRQVRESEGGESGCDNESEGESEGEAVSEDKSKS